MMDKCENVIKGLECCTTQGFGCIENKKCPYGVQRYGSHCVDSLLRDALALLKAQEPVEPLRINHDTKWQRDTECICGECGSSFYRLKVNFCPWCGRAVKWDG